MYKTGHHSIIGRLLLIVLVSVYAILYIQDPESHHFVDSFNLVIHEAGHTICRLFGEFAYVAAGSIFQVFVPFVFVVYFFLHGERTEASVLLALVGINLINVSVYAGDAVLMQLPLLGGEAVIHDWNYLLDRLGLLDKTAIVAKVIYSLGIVTICTSIIGALISLYYDYVNDRQLLKERDLI